MVGRSSRETLTSIVMFHIDLLDLPDEILLNIFKKLGNADVLYSFLGVNNKRLENIIQYESFSSVLNIASMTQNTSIICGILDRFCDYILPQISSDVKCLILEPKYMERLFFASHYPNLTELTIVHRQNDQTLTCYISEFNYDLSFRHILKQQITKLDLIYNYEATVPRSSKAITKTRLSQNFPRLRKLSVINSIPSLCNMIVAFDDIIHPYEVVEYPHLTFLDILRVSIYYVEEFLNETRIRLPCLTRLRLDYEKLRMITKDFTRETTRRNCKNVQRLITYTTNVGSKDYYDYFPLL
ncbi:hypothetical protein I4U23_016571 [Adineta vaga]|nr:hypothetical protein I4U23_016571 [Adineta vaga]